MMTEKEKAEYLKNELRNYNVLKKWLESDDQEFNKRINYYNRKIAEYDAMLSEGNSKGIEFGHVPTSVVGEPLLKILGAQEKVIKRRDELIAIRDQDIYGFKARVKYIEECLDSLDEAWEKTLVIEYYCNDKGIDQLMHIIPRSRSQLFNDKDELIIKIIKNK